MCQEMNIHKVLLILFLWFYKSNTPKLMLEDMPYKLNALQVGVEVTGIDLNSDLKEEVIEQITRDVTKHKLMIFRDQGIVSPERQIQITKWFGEVEIAGFEQHPKSPNRQILRVSNDENEGLREFGTGGFHIDGMFMKKPNSHSIYHIIEVPSEGATVFFSLNNVYKKLSRAQKKWWQRLWVVKIFDYVRGSDRSPNNKRTEIIHPLVHKHPITKKKVLCIHLGKTHNFLIDRGTHNQRKARPQEKTDIIKNIEDAIRVKNEELLYYHQWKKGDFIISDNLAVGHLATPETQKPRDEIGLRVMHRTIVKGTYTPDRTPYRKSKLNSTCNVQ